MKLKFYLILIINLILFSLFPNDYMQAQCGADATTVSFTTNGANDQQWTVPPDVTSITIIAVGGDGGNAGANIGGSGATAQGMFSVIPGDVLDIMVGGRGESKAAAFTAGGGGGGSGVRDNADNLMIAAGGGGGASMLSDGGGGSATNDGTVMPTSGFSDNGVSGNGGENGGGFNSAGTPVGGGDQGSGGFVATGGSASASYEGTGAFGMGGGGAAITIDSSPSFSFGGGGGGYSGGAIAGGGGSFDAGNSSITITPGTNGGGTESNGSVTICYVVKSPEVPTLSEWGLIVLALLLMTLGTLVLVQPNWRRFFEQER